MAEELKPFKEWVEGLPENVCGRGLIPVIHYSSGLMTKFEQKCEYLNAAFDLNADETVISEIGRFVDVDKIMDDFEAMGFEDNGSGFEYTGNCTKPRMLVVSLVLETIGNQQEIQFALFKDSGEGFEMIDGTAKTHEFRFGGVFESVIINTIVRLNEGDRFKLMLRNNASTNNVIIESMRLTVL